MPYNEECEQQQELYWNEVFDEDDEDLAVFSGKVLKFDKPVTGDNIIWSNTYGQSIEVKGKDSLCIDFLVFFFVVAFDEKIPNMIMREHGNA